MIWARLHRSARGQRPSLTHEVITRVAIEIADADGIEALSMRKVASRLGAGTMSLYRYVATKQDVLDLMVDAVIGEVDQPGRESGNWNLELAHIAQRTRRLAKRRRAVRTSVRMPSGSSSATLAPYRISDWKSMPSSISFLR